MFELLDRRETFVDLYIILMMNQSPQLTIHNSFGADLAATTGALQQHIHEYSFAPSTALKL